MALNPAESVFNTVNYTIASRGTDGTGLIYTKTFNKGLLSSHIRKFEVQLSFIL